MKVGDVIRVRNIQTVSPDASFRANWSPDREKKAEKKEVFVLLVLGTEKLILDESSERCDANKVLEGFGWKYVGKSK